MKLILIVITCLGLTSPVKAGDPKNLGGAAALVLVGAIIEVTILAGGTYTLIKNTGSLNNEWEPSITPGYIFGVSNVTVGTIIALNSRSQYKPFGIAQITLGILGFGSTVWASSESNKKQPTIVTSQIPDEVKLNSESWYTYWGLGLADVAYPSGIQNEIDWFDKQNGVSHISFSTDMFGFYWHLTPKTIGGFIINASRESFKVRQFDNHELEINQYLYAVGMMHYIGEAFGSGPFVRADLGLAGMKQNSGNKSIREEDGFGLLAGGGWSFDFGGTRLLLNANYAYRGLENENYHTISFSVGGLF